VPLVWPGQVKSRTGTVYSYKWWLASPRKNDSSDQWISNWLNLFSFAYLWRALRVCMSLSMRNDRSLAFIAPANWITHNTICPSDEALFKLGRNSPTQDLPSFDFFHIQRTGTVLMVFPRLYFSWSIILYDDDIAFLEVSQKLLKLERWSPEGR